MDTRLSDFREKIENEIRACVKGGGTPVFGLDTMNLYHLGFCDRDGNTLPTSKGKYLRPLLCMAVCAGLGGDPEQALPAAACLELTHRTTLIFDDIQDNGMERNGQPAMWSIWGCNQAINAGLALSCHARLAVQRSIQRGLSFERTLKSLNVLENAVLDLCRGQYKDLAFMERLDLKITDYLGMIEGKTGALFGAAAQVGAICAGVNDCQAAVAQELGTQMGMAFQIWDDYLGIWGDEDQVGKTANDLTEKKRSFPVVWALEFHPKVMAKWLQMETITPEEAKTIRFWMTSAGLQEVTRSQAKARISRSQALLKSLFLSQEWEDQIDQLLSLVVTRIK